MGQRYAWVHVAVTPCVRVCVRVEKPDQADCGRCGAVRRVGGLALVYSHPASVYPVGSLPLQDRWSNPSVYWVSAVRGEVRRTELLCFSRWIKACLARSELVHGRAWPCCAANGPYPRWSIHVSGVAVSCWVYLGVTAPATTVAGRDARASLSFPIKTRFAQSPPLRPSPQAIVSRRRRPSLSAAVPACHIAMAFLAVAAAAVFG